MSPFIKSLPVLVLYPHARCNCRCLMCDIWKDTTQAEISSEQLRGHLEDIERLQVKWVVFSGGEPLMHSDLFRLSDMLREKGIRVTLLTTGLLLQRYAEEVAFRTDDLIVSLDGPPDVHDRIRRVAGATARLVEGVLSVLNFSPDYPVTARFTVQHLNHSSVVDTARFASQIGCRSLSFLAADLSSEAFNRAQPWNSTRQSEIALTSAEADVLQAQFAALSQEWSGSGFIAETPAKLARIILHFRAHLGLAEPEAPVCNAPWTSAVIEANGIVRPCFFHRPIGSLRGHTLFEVLNGVEAQAFRSSLDQVNDPKCRRCVCSLRVR